MIPLDRTNTLVVIPAYNEEGSIISVIEEIKASGFPFVVIDDGSVDGTRRRTIEAGARIVSLPFNTGVGGALKCGFRFAVENGYRAVIQFDADGQHPTGHLTKLVEYANQISGHLVIGTRFHNKSGSMDISRTRRIAMKFLSFVTNRKTPIVVSDTTSGFRLISEPLLTQFARSFPKYYLGDTFEAVNVAALNGYVLGEVSVPFANRTIGESTSSNLNSILSIVKILCVTRMGLHFRIERYKSEDRSDYSARP
jgi:glycosyltransferase involved in cell wall biosynthesis